MKIPTISEEATIQLGGGGVVVLGVAGSLFYASQKSFDFTSVASCALAIGGAALLLGTFTGFLFGVPRAGEQSSEQQGVSGNSARNSDDAIARPYRPNTNLEQISDWLTKILVGVGLTQLAQAPAAAGALANALSPLLGGAPFSGGFGVALALYSFISGFFIAYLFARLKLGAAFAAADLGAVGDKVKALEVRLAGIDSATTRSRMQAMER